MRIFLQFKHFYDLKMEENYQKQIGYVDWDLPDVYFTEEEIRKFPRLQELGPRMLKLAENKYEKFQEFKGL